MSGIKDKNFSDFNKEIIFGEGGAIVGAALISSIASHFTLNRTIIAQFAVIGSFVGGSSIFLLEKIKNKIRRKEPIFKSIIRDLEYFTPAAAVIGLTVGYPTLYYITKFLVKMKWHIFLSGAVAEICAFSLFLILINLYRLILVRKFKRDIA
ncbi:MAG TPA: hypothetical protein VMC80_00350 [Patescibacteria group bacterium]|nr:hypothetical protein [Patescibacteria group bacterium]